ncbi:MAG: HAD family hydrolase [bacterium]|nr:HAD family hydrolase [bacterium]
MKTKMFLDFDGTLFDTNTLKKKLYNLCVGLGFSSDVITQSYRLECADGLFSPDGLVRRLAKIKKIDFQIAADGIKMLTSESAKYLFDDTIDFLTRLDRNKFEINLMTLGDLSFQRRKVENSGLSVYFDNIYYVGKNKWEIMDQYVEKDELFIFIDDREDTIYNVAQKYPSSVCLCIKRKDEDRDDPNHRKAGGNITKIKSLSEALAYIKN